MKQPRCFDTHRTPTTFLPCAQTARVFVALVALTFTGIQTIIAQGTAFTYQGRFTDNGAPYTGNAEFQATLWDAVSAGSQSAANTPAQIVVGVTNGLFVLPLNFGANFPGANRWLQLEVRIHPGEFTPLTPRQPITPAPYAITAGNLSGPVTSSNLAGTYSSALTLNNAANSFSGSGAGLTTLDAGQLTSGAVPDARLGANVARTNQVWLLGGNAGAGPGVKFLGTTDDQPLELRVNGARAMRLEPNATSPNVIAGYVSNSVSPGVFGATIAGGGRDGFVHSISAHHGTIGGGDRNTVSGEDGTIAGGGGNVVAGNYGSVGGGLFNINLGFVGTIAGGRSNTIQFYSDAATVGGGYLNTIQPNAAYATIGGGVQNTIQPYANKATIAGGYFNTIETYGDVATIGGGYANTIQFNAQRATISGGDFNTIQPNAYSATIGGGNLNTIQADAEYATIPGGFQNSAASHAFAAGRRAKANHPGAFVWADATNADFASTANNQFCIRASGGVQLNGDTSIAFGTTTRQMLNFYGQGFGIGVQTGTLYSRSNTRFSWFKDGSHSDFENDPGGGTVLMTLAASGLTVNSHIIAPGMSFGSTLSQKINLYGTTFGIGIQSGVQYSRVGVGGGFAWYAGGVHHDDTYQPGQGGTPLMKLDGSQLTVNSLLIAGSDRNLKENFAPVQPREMLEKVVALPLSSWNLKADPAIRHVGPMSQDFYAAFNLGADDKHIATVDADGVALAAIQGLNQKLEEKNAELQALKQTVAELKARFDQLGRAQPANPVTR